MQHGFCLSHAPDGLPVFLHGAVPGERVRARISRSAQDHAFATAVEILNGPDAPASPPEAPVAAPRIANDCPAFPECGGCSLRHIAYEDELSLKLELLNELPHVRSAREDVAAAGREERLHAGPPDESRNHVQLHTDGERRGFFALHSNRIVPLPEQGCRQVPPELNAAMQSFDLSKAPESAGPSDASESSQLTDEQSDNPGARSRKLAFRWTSYGVVLPEAGRRGMLRERIGEFNWDFPRDGFFQPNRFLIAPWLQAIREMIPAGRPGAIELFAGAGLIGGFVRDRLGGRYVAFESERASLRAAEKNFRRLKLRGEFRQLDLYRRTARIPRGVGLAIVDPPRAGLKRKEQIREFAEARLPCIIYSSCNPQTLNRDLGRFFAAGYRCTAFEIFDFFPRTPHVELLVKLELPPKSAPADLD